MSELKEVKFEPSDIMVSFDIVSLYTNISTKEVVEVINRITNPDIAKLVEIFFTLTFFSFEGEFYEQTCGVEMGSPLSHCCEPIHGGF